MTERILILHDGSTLADKAIEVATKLAQDRSEGLYILAIAPGDPQDERLRTISVPAQPAAFDEIAEKLGVEIVGGCIVRPTESALRSLIDAQHITHVVLASDQVVDNRSRSGRFLSAFARSCPVPVSIVP